MRNSKSSAAAFAAVIVSFFVFVAGLFSSSTAFALDVGMAGNCLTKQYKLGSSTEFTDTTIIPGIATTLRNEFGSETGLNIQEAINCGKRSYDRCVVYPDVNGQCEIVVTGYSDDNRYKTVHSAHDGGLAIDRQSRISRPLMAMLGEQGPSVVKAYGQSEAQDGQRFVHIRVGIRTGLSVSTAQAKPPTACSDGEDNDNDGFTDLEDPGCEENSDDTDEWNPSTDPDKRWANMMLPVVFGASNPCSSTVTGWWGAKDHQFHHRVEISGCGCSSGDTDPQRPGLQIMSPNAVASDAMSAFIPLVQAGASGKVTWTQVRSKVQAPMRADTVDYVDLKGADDTSVTFGRSASVIDSGDLMIVSFPDLCQESLRLAKEKSEATRLRAYQKTHFWLGAELTAGKISKVGDLYDFTGGPVGSLGLIGGLTTSGGFTAAVAVGPGYNPNCWVPGTLNAAVSLGYRTNRPGGVGLAVDLEGIAEIGLLNQAVVFNAYRGQAALGMAFHPRGDRESVSFTPQFLLGMDVISAMVNGGDGHTYVPLGTPVVGFRFTLTK